MKNNLRSYLTQILWLKKVSLINADLSTPVEEVGSVVSGEKWSRSCISSPVDNSSYEHLSMYSTHMHTNTHIYNHNVHTHSHRGRKYAEETSVISATTHTWINAGSCVSKEVQGSDHLAIVDMDHLILQRLCQLTEKDAVIQPLHQTVSSEVHIYTHTCTIDYYKLFITMG